MLEGVCSTCNSSAIYILLAWFNEGLCTLQKHFILSPPVTKLSKAPLLMIRYQTQNAAWIVSVSFCILSRRNLVINSKQEFIDKLFQFNLAPTGRNFRLNDPRESSRLFGKTTAILPAFYCEKLNIAPQVTL